MVQGYPLRVLRRESGVKLLGFPVFGVGAQKNLEMYLGFGFTPQVGEAGGQGVTHGFHVAGFWSGVGAAIITGVVSWIAAIVIGDTKQPL